MEGLCGQFFASPQYLNEIYVEDVEKCLRRIKEKYTAEYTRVCGTMGWRDYAIGNLSAMETGELGPVEIKMKQIIEEQDTEKAKKRKKKRSKFDRQAWKTAFFLELRPLL